jgi:hypothetical protein
MALDVKRFEERADLHTHEEQASLLSQLVRPEKQTTQRTAVRQAPVGHLRRLPPESGGNKARKVRPSCDLHP